MEIIVLPSCAPAFGPVVGRGSVAARTFPSSADWREQEGDGGVSLPLFGSSRLLSAPCVSKETVFQVICWDFTGISSLTYFLPWAWMPAGSSLTSSCGMSKQFSPWGIKELSPSGCWIRHRGSWKGQRGPSPERSGRKGGPPSPWLGNTSLVFSLWLKQRC